PWQLRKTLGSLGHRARRKPRRARTRIHRLIFSLCRRTETARSTVRSGRRLLILRPLPELRNSRTEWHSGRSIEAETNGEFPSKAAPSSSGQYFIYLFRHPWSTWVGLSHHGQRAPRLLPTCRTAALRAARPRPQRCEVWLRTFRRERDVRNGVNIG